MLPIKLVKPGVLEIKGNFSHSPHFYLPVLSIRSFVVHKQPSCIELHMRSLTPGGATVLKNVDCRPELMTQTVEFLSECISTTSPNNTGELLEELNRRIVALEAVSGSVNPAHQALEELTMFLREMVDRSDRACQERRLNEEIYSEGSLTQGEGVVEEKAEPEAEAESDATSVISDLSEPLEALEAAAAAEDTAVSDVVSKETTLSLLGEYRDEVIISALVISTIIFVVLNPSFLQFRGYSEYP